MFKNHSHTVFLALICCSFGGRKIVSKTLFFCHSSDPFERNKTKLYFMLNIKCLLKDFLNHVGIVLFFLLFFTESFLKNPILFLESTTCRVRIRLKKRSNQKMFFTLSSFFSLIIGHYEPPA